MEILSFAGAGRISTFFPDRHILKMGPGFTQGAGPYHFWRDSQYEYENLFGFLVFWGWLLRASALPAALLSTAMSSWRPYWSYRTNRGNRRYRSYRCHGCYRGYWPDWPHGSHRCEW